MKEKNAPKSFPRDGTTRVQSFSVDEYFCASIMTVFGCVYEKCFYLQRWWWWWCRYRDGIYKQTSMCSLHSIEFLYNAPSTRTCTHVQHIYIYTWIRNFCRLKFPRIPSPSYCIPLVIIYRCMAECYYIIE